MIKFWKFWQEHSCWFWKLGLDYQGHSFFPMLAFLEWFRTFSFFLFAFFTLLTSAMTNQPQVAFGWSGFLLPGWVKCRATLGSGSLIHSLEKKDLSLFFFTISHATEKHVKYSFVFRVEAASDIVALPDLIWDAHWLYQDKVPKLVAIATAHNAVWCWDWEGDVKQLVSQCEEPCILYPLYRPIRP